VAAEEAGRTLCYADLVGLADAAAAALRESSVRAGDVVAVLAERTAVLPAVLLGVLSVGARWVILDRELPDVALDRRLTAVRPRALVQCLRAGDAAAPRTRWTGPAIDAARLTAVAPAAGPSADVPAASRGYLAFTSGTTGEPRVVDTGEAPLVHFLSWYRAAFDLDNDLRSAMLSGVAHDPLLRDIFVPLTCGGVCAVPPPELLRDPSGLLAWLDSSAISVAHLTPQLARMLAGAGQRRTLESLWLAAVGGDQLTEGDVAALRRIAPHARVVNCYGTTETPQVQACHEVPPQPRAAGSAEGTAAWRAAPVPVGVGIDGAELLVMSTCGQPAAVGELGEVVVRSRYLSNGYAGDHRDSQPFAALPGAGDGGVFRTGDLGRYGPSGAVTLAGRADDQVKVRGYRVELGEVEAALSSHPDVERAAVQLFERDGATVLHAYVVRAASALAGSDVLRHARSLLPPYAVPSGVTMLATLPLSGGGKVDRSRLPSPGQHGPASPGYDVPQGRLERLVLAVWREVLGLPRIGSNDNFFEIGGHSMAIIEVQSRLRRALGRQIQVVDLFRFPTIRTLAGHLASGGADERLLDAEMRGRQRRERAGRSRAQSGGTGPRRSPAPP
jgi:amino acid adenylation domain-containing protein